MKIEVKYLYNIDHKVSSVFNLEEDYGQRLNFND